MNMKMTVYLHIEENPNLQRIQILGKHEKEHQIKR